MSPFDAALPSTEDLFSVIEAIHDNVAIVDHNGVMRWVSSCFERNYGISRDRVIGRTTYELEAEKVFSPSVAALVLKTRRVVTLTEATRSGQYNIVTGVPIYDDDGDVSFVVSYSAANEVMPAESVSGRTSTRSIPTRRCPGHTPRISLRASWVVKPPISGVPVPGA